MPAARNLLLMRGGGSRSNEALELKLNACNWQQRQLVSIYLADAKAPATCYSNQLEEIQEWGKKKNRDIKFHRFDYWFICGYFSGSRLTLTRIQWKFAWLRPQLINNFHFIFISKFDLITWKSVLKCISHLPLWVGKNGK